MTFSTSSGKYRLNYWKLLAVALLIFYIISSLKGVELYKQNFESKGFLILDDADLVMHEMGHFLFGFLGVEFLMIAGGTLIQIIMPAAAFIYFKFFRREKYGAWFGVFWAGVNLIDISVYAGDARTLQLPLTTGGTGADSPESHDWYNMLSRFDLLQYDTKISAFIYGLGIIFLIASVIFALYLCFDKVLEAEAEEEIKF